MDRKDFEKLERLNAWIDVWIDEEEYQKVIDTLPVSGELKVSEENLASCVETCFNDPNCTNTKPAKKEWRKALDENAILPIRKVRGVELREGVEIDECWSRLFFAKLFRARVQEKGTDCYLSRLDEVVRYLENHLPPLVSSKPKMMKMAVLYLLELSAASRLYEGLGFAERARRVIEDHPEVFGKDHFGWFYDLLAKYNIGVAHFHNGQYRKAVLEFNWIIRQVNQEESKKGFFDKQLDKKVLLLPAILFRANIQLKLQLAFHALDTLDKHFRKFQGTSEYKDCRAKLITAEAYQQLGDLRKGFKHLNKASQALPLGKPLGKRLDCVMPTRDQGWPDLRGRLTDLLIENHTDYLLLEGEDSKQLALKLAFLVQKHDEKTPIAEYEDAIKEAKPYLDNLKNAFQDSYCKIVEHNDEQRKGYYQQLAKYLAWLANAANPKLTATPNTKPIVRIMRNLYDNQRKGKKEGILVEEKDDGKAARCPRCARIGIDLQRLQAPHYDWFTEHMLKFFRERKDLRKDKAKFVKRLINLERESGEDLRIRDLELRYKLEDKLWEPIPCPITEPCGELCWQPAADDDPSGFAGLLHCFDKKYGHKEVAPLLVGHEHYEHVIDQWDKRFLRQLESRSYHKSRGTGLYFSGLQRWNSSSPAQGRSVGGGYLLYHTKNGHVDLGIAIDPGFDFVRNLFHVGFSLRDIDIVVISHAHIDHIRDFESMIILLQEVSKRGKSKQGRRLHVILSLGAYRRLEHIIEDPTFRYFIEPYIIDIGKEIHPSYFEDLLDNSGFCFQRIPCGSVDSEGTPEESHRPSCLHRPMDYQAVPPPEESNTETYPCVNIRPTRAYHDDHSGYSDSFGFLIEVRLSWKDDDKVVFGYTGDTKWVYPELQDPVAEEEHPGQGRIIRDIVGQYDCDIVLAHLGSLIEKNDQDEWSFEYYSKQKNCERLVQTKNHPYLIGLLRLLSGLCRRSEENECKKIPLILLSEFGEELRGGIRVDLVERLRRTYGSKLAFLPVDVGMDVQLSPPHIGKGETKATQRVWCVQCEQYVPINDAEFERYGVDEALYCVCKTCRKATPLNVLQDRLRQIYEVGYELVRRDET